MTSESDLLRATRFRQAGPFRGGRSVAVAGHTDQPLTYYFGACTGGVWKTVDGGLTWRCITDGYLKTSSVGALAVAESDPNVIYAGMGEACIRGNVSHGDGVYKSTDAGKTWQHLGLEETRHIARVRVHPQNPNLVYVAAFGHTFGPTTERGIFRSKDGGQSWEKILYRDEKTGASDLTMNPNNPRVLYAGFWEAHRTPWSLVSGGEGSGIFKTTDGGDTWVELTDNPGLPSGLKGRIGVTVSPVQPERVWALIEAEQGGLYRSDDGGKTWQLVSDNPALMQRPWYYMHVFADPADADRVYVLNLRMWQSDDAGSSWKQIPTPHGDNHDLWIDPNNTDRMVEANDGGACVSFNGGATWSTIYNQPTAQFYHVITDTQFPYRIYGAQQDNSTISIPSYADRGAITVDESYPVGGSESGYIAVRPDDPNIVFAGGYASRMTRYDHRSKQEVDVTVYPDDPIGYGAEAMKYRFQWTFPIAISHHDPDVLFVCGNHVFQSNTGGQSFEAISPDLTRGDPETLGPSGGPITKDNVSTEYYGTVFAFAESPVQQGILWAGSDDGRISVTQDGGKSWNDVTPQLLPDWSLISIIEASPHDAATAFVAATCYKQDDFSPYLLKTHDYGENWEMITNGIPEQDFTRAIREDPERQGLLYAGTETGLYVSWDEGGQWLRFPDRGPAELEAAEHGLPLTPIHDMVVHGSDLVVGTHGRSFWILDDLTPIRSWSDVDLDQPATLFPVRPTYRLQEPHRWPAATGAIGFHTYARAGGNQAMSVILPDGEGGTTVELVDAGANPEIGVLVHYHVGKQPPEQITLGFYTAAGELIREFKSDDDDKKSPKPDTSPGLNRFVWNMRYPDATSIENASTLSAYWGGSTIGPVTVPGEYEVRLNVDGKESTQRFEIKADPRNSATQDDLEVQFELLRNICDRLTEIHETVNRSKRIREQIASWQGRLSEADHNDLAERAGQIAERLLDAESDLVEWRASNNADVFNYPPKLNRKFASLQGTVAYGQARPPQQCFDVYEDLRGQAEQHLKELNKILDDELGSLNDAIRESGAPVIG